MSDERSDIAYVFPGQGAQHVGMGRDVYERLTAGSRVFDRAEEVTGLPLKKLCFEGPEEELARTDIAQPAIFTVSAAMLAAMDDLHSPEQLEGMRPAFAAGLSLGEYTALYAADALDFDDMLKLVARRGELMQQAATAVPSGMVSVLGLDEDAARRLCDAAADGQVLACANFNSPGQVVLAGEIDACRRVERLAEEHGAKGAIPLKVAGAFHSPLMQPAAEAFAEALDAVEFRRPRVEVIANVDARAYSDASGIRDGLLRQLTSPIRWQQSMEYARGHGIERFYEIGPGKVLRGLLRRIDRAAECTCVNSLDALEKLSAGT